ncbi:MAG: phosphate ABC transporter permease PstA [Actinobacteria bacterium]|nr:MAG: phosphate ABC transporter permease PstA [Actinomycetota bacterium]
MRSRTTEGGTTGGRLADKAARLVAWMVSLASLAVLLLIIGQIVIRGVPGFELSFLTTAPRGIRMEGGVFPMIVASFYLTVLSLLVVGPIGVGAAVYLAEFAGDNRLTRAVRFAADTLAGVPSIVFGLFGLAFFVYALGMGYSMLSGALTLSIMALPTMLRVSEEAIRAVPDSYREGSLGLGATRWHTVLRVVLPSALPGIGTAAILATGRVFGETAAVLYTAGQMPGVPQMPLDGGRTLTVHLWLLATTGKLEQSYPVAVVLLVVILSFNLGATWLMNRFRRRFVA